MLKTGAELPHSMGSAVLGFLKHGRSPALSPLDTALRGGSTFPGTPSARFVRSFALVQAVDSYTTAAAQNYAQVQTWRLSAPANGVVCPWESATTLSGST